MIRSNNLIQRIPLNPERDYSYFRLEKSPSEILTKEVALSISNGTDKPIGFLLKDETLKDILKKIYYYLEVAEKERLKYEN